MFGLQKIKVAITTLPNTLPFSNILLSGEDPPAILSGGVDRCTAADEYTFVQVAFQSDAGFVFKCSIGDLIMAVVIQSSGEEWVAGHIDDSGVNSVAVYRTGWECFVRFRMGRTLCSVEELQRRY
jgi:hypothetical protein